MNAAESRQNGGTPSLGYPALIAFSVSAATLLLQLVQTRIYGVVFWNHLVYFIVSIALLGFGISGTWLAFGPDTRIARWLTLRNAALGFVLTTIIASLFAPQLGVGIASIVTRSPRALQLLLTYSVAVLPYFFAGWMLGTIFRDHAKRIHTLYFADLVGAALGCVAYLALIQTLGAVRLVLVTCVLVALPPLVTARRLRSTQLWGGAVLFVLAALWIASDALNNAIRPEPSKAYHALYQTLDADDAKVVELSEWNALSRIDVISRSADPSEKRIFIDGDAWTGMVIAPELPPPPYHRESEQMLTHNAPYFFHPGGVDSALVIGTGGGIDVYLALRGGAKRVDAVEINPTTWRIMREEYETESNGLVTAPNIHTYNEEGRSFVKRTKNQYDVIMLHGIDTFAALNAGAYVLSENYLYTVEAVRDYLAHLRPDGILCITRWIHYAESPRLFAVCLEALYAAGVEDPERHILFHSGAAGTILVKSTPFSDAEIRSFSAHLEKWGGTLFHPVNEADRTEEVQRTIAAYADHRARNTHKAYVSTLSFDILPVYDDSPFFFHYDKPRHMLNVFREVGPANFIRGHWPSFTLFTMFGFTAIATTACILLPLARRGRPPIPGFSRCVLYFFCLGVSFIFVEIALMQRFALLLGHPSRALGLVLGALLLFAGIGSYWQGIRQVPVQRCLAVLVVAIVLSALIYPKLIVMGLGLPLPGRALLALVLVAPLGILMGIPFPSGLQAIARSGGDAVPWMWGINGGATVVGSVLAIVIAIWTNFTTVLLIAGAGYALALYCCRALPGDDEIR